MNVFSLGEDFFYYSGDGLRLHLYDIKPGTLSVTSLNREGVSTASIELENGELQLQSIEIHNKSNTPRLGILI